MRFVAAALLAVVSIAAGTGAAAPARAQGDDPPGIGTVSIVIDRDRSREPGVPALVDELAPQTVLTVTATGFEPDTTGTIEQCLGAEAKRCRNRLSVRFDDDGGAVFQYLVTDAIAGSAEDMPCRRGSGRCTVELRVADDIRIVETVFVDRAPAPGRLTVTPQRNLRVGDTLTIEATSFPPRARVTVMVCAAGSEREVSTQARCGGAGLGSDLEIGADGTAATTFTLDDPKVGSDGVACGRRVKCRVVVTSDELGVRAAPVNLGFAASEGAAYSPARLSLGLSAALVLAVAAAWLIRSTAWVLPGEADSSPIDDAEFADLDSEAAAFPEDPPIPSEEYVAPGVRGS